MSAPELSPEALGGMRVTIMGLGLHGGGLASALFFARSGARVTVTDLRGADVLEPSIERLAGLAVRLVLGGHQERDFVETDLVIKNPAVRLSSPFLRRALDSGVPVETDVSVFLRLCPNPLIAVSGSKGKSTVAAAIHHALGASQGARLGGNITVSPLEFITPPSALPPDVPVVLELSSWQLGDLRGKEVLDPAVSVLTVLFRDHMDAYGGDMHAYIRDKAVLFQGQGPSRVAVFNRDDPLQSGFPAQTRARALHFSAFESGADAYLSHARGMLRTASGPVAVLEEGVGLRGEHNRLNLLAAALALHGFGMALPDIARALRSYGGLEHRMEMFLEHGGIRFCNDSAATVPEAALAAARTVDRPFLIICGGNDKSLDFGPFERLAPLARKAYVLDGTASPHIVAAFRSSGTPLAGPYGKLGSAVADAMADAPPGCTVLFSPGCTSFGMFLNEFDRGRKFKQTVRELLGLGDASAGPNVDAPVSDPGSRARGGRPGELS